MLEHHPPLTSAEISDDVTAKVAELLLEFRAGLAASLRDELAAVGVTGDAALALALDRGRRALWDLADELRDLDAPPSVTDLLGIAEDAIDAARRTLIRDAA